MFNNWLITFIQMGTFMPDFRVLRERVSSLVCSHIYWTRKAAPLRPVGLYTIYMTSKIFLWSQTQLKTYTEKPEAQEKLLTIR